MNFPIDEWILIDKLNPKTYVEILYGENKEALQMVESALNSKLPDFNPSSDFYVISW